MPPKPFPFLFGVGVDIAQVARFTRLLERGDQEFLRWARRIFTRLEWPALQEQCRLWNPLEKSSKDPQTILQSPGSLSSEDVHRKGQQQEGSMNSGLSALLTRPFTRNTSKEQNQVNWPNPFLPQLQAPTDSTFTRDTSQRTKLAQYISGRFGDRLSHLFRRLQI